MDHGPGTHTWPYWIDDMRDTYLPRLRQLFADRPPPPVDVHYESVDEAWTQWGWDVELDRPTPRQFSYLDAAGPSGFALTGAGTATVRTPPFYGPGTVRTVTVAGPAGTTTSAVVADEDGRLTLEVPLAGGATPEVLARTTLIGHQDTPAWGGTSTVTIH